MTDSTSRLRWARRALWVALMVVIAGGTALRLAFMLVSHLHVDEYSSIWASMQVLDKGIPLLPSGFLYLQGVLYTYLGALAIALLGSSGWAARVPSLLLSALTIAVVFAWGRRAFGYWFGLMAASLTALAPDSIQWGGRARMYALQQALFLLAMYAFLCGYVEVGRKPFWRWAFAGLFVGALLSHTVTVLAIPPLALSLWVWRRTWRTETQVLGPLAILACGTVLAVSLHFLGGPVTDTVGRPFASLSIPWQPKPEYFFRELLWSWPAVLRTLFFVVGFVCLSVSLVRGAIAFRTGAPPKLFSQPGVTNLFYLYAIVGLTLLSMIFLVGESWQRPRYLLMLQPVIDLLVVGVLWYLHSAFRCFAGQPPGEERNGVRVRRGSATRTVIGGAVIWLCAVVVFLPAAIGAVGPAEPAYDSAFRYISEHWREGDAIVGPLPSIPATYLGQCDGYMIQDGFSEYLVWQNGQPVDRWTGAPLIDSVESFKRHFGPQRRVWFAVDSDRLQQRYTQEFRDFVEQNMSVVFRTSDVTVFQR